MGLKILHTADWHLDSPFSSFPESERQELKQEQRRLPDLLADTCRKEHCDLILMAGDIFDGQPTKETLNLLKKALYACAVPVFIAPGNHDYCDPGSPWMEDDWPENVCIFTGDWSCVDLPDLDARIYGAGYRSMDCPPLLEGFQAEGNARYHIAVLHADPTQANSPYCPITVAQVRDSGLHYLALGHIHQSGGFQAGITTCAWPGCPMGRGWDETEEHGFCLVNLGEETEILPIVLDTPRFYTHTVSIEDSAERALEQVLPPVYSRDYYRVTLTGSGEADMESLRNAFPHLPHLTLIDRTEPALDYWEDLESDSFRGVYFRMLKDMEMQMDDSRAEIVRLAADISYRLLEGREVNLP